MAPRTPSAFAVVAVVAAVLSAGPARSQAVQDWTWSPVAGRHAGTAGSLSSALVLSNGAARPLLSFMTIASASAPANGGTPRSVAEQTAEDRTAEDTASSGDYVDGVYIIDPDYLLSYPKNLYRLATAPARFDGADWIATGLVAAAAGALFLLDEPLQDFWQDDIKSDTTEDGAEIFEVFGDSKNIVYGSLAAYAVAETLDSSGMVDARREKSAALPTLESFLLTQGIVTGLKYVTGHNRPEESDGAFDFEGPSKGDSNASFPSGHAGSAFAVATVLSETYGADNPWVPYLAYPVAAGTAFARIDDDRHWFSDVFVGGVIGFAVGRTVTRYSPFLARNNITLQPFTQANASGLGVNVTF